MEFYTGGLIDIKVVLQDDPLKCTPCRLHPAPQQSVICRPASQISTIPIANASLFDQIVPVLNWLDSILLLAVSGFWELDGQSVAAAMKIVLPTVKSMPQLVMYRNYSALAVSQLKKVAQELSEDGLQSFRPILDLVPNNSMLQCKKEGCYFSQPSNSLEAS